MYINQRWKVFRCASISCFQVVTEWVTDTFSDLQSLQSGRAVSVVSTVYTISTVSTVSSVSSVSTISTVYTVYTVFTVSTVSTSKPSASSGRFSSIFLHDSTFFVIDMLKKGPFHLFQHIFTTFTFIPLPDSMATLILFLVISYALVAHPAMWSKEKIATAAIFTR